MDNAKSFNEIFIDIYEKLDRIVCILDDIVYWKKCDYEVITSIQNLQSEIREELLFHKK